MAGVDHCQARLLHLKYRGRKNYLSEEEWQFWYEGKPALKVLNGIDDHPLIPEGTVRSGGSYTQRMSNIAVWNSVMDEHNYLVRKWRELTKV